MWEYQINWRRFMIGVVYNTCGINSGGCRELGFFLGPLHVEYHWARNYV